MSATSHLEPPTTTSPCLEIVDAVAEREGVDPAALRPRIYDVIDPDALERVLETGAGADATPVEISFTYCGYDVSVTADGTVEVE